ncbi:MAG: glycosyltransferase [Methanosarcinales archaeon]
MKKLSVIMPAYNVGQKIQYTLHECINTFNNIDIDYEIIVIDDGSKDNTYDYALISSYITNNRKIRVVSYKENGGKGFAIKYGSRLVTGDIVSFIDADLDIHPIQLKLFLEYMEEYNADVVIGSKRHPLSKVNYPLNRKILSSGYSLLNRLLFNLSVKDTQVGLKLFKGDIFKKVIPKVLVKRYAFDLELLVLISNLNYKIIEAPIEINYNFDSSVDLKAIWHILIDTLAVSYRLHILKYYDI